MAQILERQRRLRARPNQHLHPSPPCLLASAAHVRHLGHFCAERDGGVRLPAVGEAESESGGWVAEGEAGEPDNVLPQHEDGVEYAYAGVV